MCGDLRAKTTQWAYCKANPNSDFYGAISALKLTNGQNASSVVKPYDGHSDHFHFRFAAR
jgi:hypothetical protein